MAENKVNKIEDVALNKSKYRYLKVKKRNWVFVLYPQSAPGDWRDILQKTGLEVAISPLHDKDKNPDMTLKKEHYHVIVLFPGPTTGSVVWDLVVETLGQPMPLPLESVRGMYRYLVHKDNPEKFQYDEKEITTINGFDIDDYADLSSADKSRIKLELVKLIKEEVITEYADFINKLVELDKSDYFFIGSTNTIFFNSYISSIRNKIRDEQKKNYYFIDKKTGEIIDTETENREA